MRKTIPLHLLKFGLQRTAGPYSWVTSAALCEGRLPINFCHTPNSDRGRLAVQYVAQEARS